MKERPADIKQKEIRIERIERRIQKFFDCRKVDGHVLDAGVIAVDENGRGSQAEKTRQISTVHTPRRPITGSLALRN